MFNTEQRRIAIETFIKLNYSCADTVALLGYPTTATLRNWWREYKRTGEVPISKFESNPKYPLEKKAHAVAYYLGHGKNIAKTMRDLGYPKNRKMLMDWIDEIAPGQRVCKSPNFNDKMQVVSELKCSEDSMAQTIQIHDMSQAAPYIWRRQIIGDNNKNTEEKGVCVNKEFDELPDDIEQLQEMLREARVQLHKVQLELDVHKATLEIVKKDQGAKADLLSNPEKAVIAEALRSKYKLREILAVLGMAKSSYEYAKNVQAKGKTKQHASVRKAVVDAFRASNETYGYRRICAVVDAGEWTVRNIMKEENLIARIAKKKHRYSSYEGETSIAPPNLLRDKQGKHHFRSENPNELWITDISEFRIPAGKVYLSPIIDCFDGMPLSWSMSTSPDAQMANSSLLGACKWLADGDHPIVHSDRGGHYRWTEWIRICDERSLVRSMSRKGCSPDNARCEGFFGRLKIEFFYGCDWRGITIEEFMGMLDAYLRWYRDIRLKSDLDYKSPMQYRRDLGLIA